MLPFLKPGSLGEISLIQRQDKTNALPGRSITLNCEVSGYNIDDHHMHWLRKATEKRLVYVAGFRTGYPELVADGLKDRVRPSTSGSTAQLRIDDLKAEDTAIYYCAREHAAASQITLIQPDSEMKLPGQTLTLSCKMSSSSSFPHYWIEWTQKIGDQGVLWVGEISPDGAGTNIRRTLRGRFSISRDNSANTVSLEIRKLESGDAGIYYCSAHSEIDLYTN
ncbi:hypothetical protein JRQ81_004374 [Phrynocephalus forsythii]|uniref:Ig-like domain-containing protein n=1 Tax=Phrynocephalus forsythii TaxID=171643 RepID=A0A9Q0XFL5_9SAUR|nr:hypothetical protein JRQ81_004374 [Phrynocephalus forsythii]